MREAGNGWHKFSGFSQKNFFPPSHSKHRAPILDNLATTQHVIFNGVVVRRRLSSDETGFDGGGGSGKSGINVKVEALCRSSKVRRYDPMVC
jgi:hypothetical protein